MHVWAELTILTSCTSYIEWMFYLSFLPVVISFKYVPHIAPTDHIVADKPMGLTNNIYWHYI